MFMQHFSTKRFALGLCFLFFLLPQVCTVKALSAESASQTDVIFAEMQGMREVIDAAEEKVSSDVWPVPTYADIIFRV